MAGSDHSVNLLCTMKIHFLVIEGNIGAGKTSLASALSKEYNAKLVLEQFADNPFLPKFYQNRERYSFALELTFLADRYNQIKKEILNFDLFYDFLISDYYFTKSAIFARNTLKKDEYNLFRRIFDIIFESMPKPDLYIYLHSDTETLLKNIEIRGRDYERDLEPSYLESIKNSYINYLKYTTDFPVLIINTNNMDFIHDTTYYNKLKQLIFGRTYQPGLHHVNL